MPRSFLLLIPLAYLLGSVPFGLLVGKAKGIDPRTAGSGNIGATNLGRLLGGRYFALVFTLDWLKGFLPMIAAAFIFLHHDLTTREYLLWLLVGFAAIFGHLFSAFLNFKGGKGVATSCGVMLGLFPYFTIPGLIAAVLWGIIFQIWRYVSLASIIAACAFPLIYIAVGLALGWPVFGAQLPLLAFAILIALMITLRHRGNITRLRAGTENRFARKSRSAS